MLNQRLLILAIALGLWLCVPSAASAVPANDNFANATALSGSNVSTAGDNIGATAEAGEPNHAGNASAHSVWWSWTAPSTGRFVIDTCDFNTVDTVLAVYTGNTLAALSEVASSDDANETFCGPKSRVVFAATVGQVYRIAVDGALVGSGLGSQTGSFGLYIKPTPANDNFANADTLSGSSASVSATNVGATKQAGEPVHAGATSGRSVWWNWTAPSNISVTLDTCSGSIYTGLAIYTGSSVNALTEVTSNATNSGVCGSIAPKSAVTFKPSAGQTYRIAVDGATASDSGPFTLRLQTAPANDDFAGADTLSGFPASTTGSNVAATTETGEPALGTGHSVWWKWTAPSTRSVIVNTCGSDFDTVEAVYTGTGVGALTKVSGGGLVFSSCPPGSPVSNQMSVSFRATAGQTYRIAVAAYGGFKEQGSISLALTPGPANDDFSDAAALTGLPATTIGSNIGASKEPGEPDHAADAGGRSVWWNWTAPSNARVRIDTCGGSLPSALLAVYTGAALNTLTEVDSSASACASPVTFTAAAGQTYRIAVDGAGGAQGGFTLTLKTVPSNDDFAGATTLSGFPATATGTSRDATKESGEPDHAGDPGGHSVWWRWTAPSSGRVSIDTCDSAFDTVLGVYTGSSVGGLSEVASNDEAPCSGGGSSVDFTATAGQTYRIAVDGSFGASGAVSLAIQGPPSNDRFANAAVLSGLRDSSEGDNFGAAKEAGEPDHDGDPGGRSVWWRWTAPGTGEVEIDTCDSDFDTLLAVYTGNAVSGLTRIDSSDDEAGCGDGSQSIVDFAAVKGRTYRIAVDGSGGELGGIGVALDEQTPPAPKPKPTPKPAATKPGPTAANDSLTGTAGADLICGLAGSDLIKGLGGDDTLFGDACGAKSGMASSVRKASASGGNDRLYGGSGKDKLYGAGGNDRLFGEAGNDVLTGGTGKDKLDGGVDSDKLAGGSGKDSLKGGKGKDKLSAGAGNDTINSRDGKRDRVDCGKGKDKVRADKKDKLRHCERVRR